MERTSAGRIAERMRNLVPPALIAVQALAGPAAPARAQAPEPGGVIVSTDWLAGRLNDPSVVVIAATDEAGYARGHIPGARLLPHMATLGDGHRLLPAEALAGALARAGAHDGARIVLYGDRPMEIGWAYMTFASVGHADRVSLLGGNLAAWIADGHAVSHDAVPPARGRLTPRPAPDVRVDASWVRERLEDRGVRVLDVRSTAEWNGGHLPGATLVAWQDLYKSQEQLRFKPREELRALFARAGVAPGQQVVTYCAIGMRASLMYFAARHVGLDARVYVGSYEDWRARPGYPIVREPDRR
jgi:thiosulfate/3-mercaptopyruvate sulfurtransferase